MCCAAAADFQCRGRRRRQAGKAFVLLRIGVALLSRVGRRSILIAFGADECFTDGRPSPLASTLIASALFLGRPRKTAQRTSEVTEKPLFGSP